MRAGFMDAASIHSAMAALMVGKGVPWPDWDQQCLLESTYLLLEEDVGIVPGPGPWRGAHGPIAYVLRRLPHLTSDPVSSRQQSERSTQQWLSRNTSFVRKALEEVERHDDWASRQVELFWSNHAEMYGSLFNPQYIPQMGAVLRCSERDLRHVHELSTKLSTVARWTKHPDSEDALVAKRAWLLASVVRGRYHEHLARQRGMHLIAHPHRSFAALRLKVNHGPYRLVTNSEELFTKIVIGCALTETSADRRVKAWVDSVVKAREARRQFPLTEQTTLADAERMAADAAKGMELYNSPRMIHRALDVGAGVTLSVLVALTISPWIAPGVSLPVSAPLGPLAVQSYRHIFGRSVGEHIAKGLLNRKRRFRRLGTAIPGRIERYLRATRNESEIR